MTMNEWQWNNVCQWMNEWQCIDWMNIMHESMDECQIINECQRMNECEWSFEYQWRKEGRKEIMNEWQTDTNT